MTEAALLALLLSFLANKSFLNTLEPSFHLDFVDKHVMNSWSQFLSCCYK